MRILTVKQWTRLLLWGVVLAALLILFARLSPPGPAAGPDERTAVVLLTEDGPRDLTMADYLPGALAAEMPASFHPEALKAQAVAIRSYVLAGPRHGGADICTDSACCLAYLTEDELRDRWGDDFECNMTAVTRAAAETDGQVLTYEGGIIPAVFHASSAGMTEDSAAVWSARPYLVSVESPETPESVPGLITEASFTPDELSSLLGLDSADAPSAWLADITRDDAGRVGFLYIAGQALSGGFVRSALGLRSTDFQVTFDGERFIFTVAGNGHGVGMSQYGADLLAGQGSSYDEILAHYYPGTALITCEAQLQEP